MGKEGIVITSRANPMFKLWKSLLGARGIKKHSLAILAGEKLVGEILTARPELVRTLIYSSRHVASANNCPSLPAVTLDHALYSELDIYGTGSVLSVVNVLEMPHFDAKSHIQGRVLCIPFQDPANVGAAIRSAAAFGFTTVVILAESAHPYHPKSLRASGNAVFAVNFFTGPSINAVHTLGLPVAALIQNVRNDSLESIPESVIILPGMEGTGMPETVKPDYCISLPMNPAVESLNAAVATSIVLFLLSNRS